MSDDLDSQLQSAAAAFQVAAERYCELIESFENLEPYELLLRLQAELPGLYVAGTRLRISADFEDDEDESDEAELLLPSLTADPGASAKAQADGRHGHAPDPVTFDFQGPMTHRQRWALFYALSVKFGPFDGYWEVFDPIEPRGPELVPTSIANDIADIYRDVREARDEIVEATHLVGAVWRAWFAFETHWGDHLTDAMRVIHRLAREVTSALDD